MDSRSDLYIVVLNCEDECAIWPADRPTPRAWRATPVRGSAAKCAAQIKALEDEKPAAALREWLQCERIRP